MINTPGDLWRITIDQGMPPIEEEEPIPEAGRIRVGQQQFPAATPVRSLVEAGQVAGSTGQDQDIERVPCPNGAKIQLPGSDWDGALLP